MKLKHILILFLVGFVLGPIGDYCHVISDTDGYPQGVFRYYFMGVPFWVPFLFGTAAVAIGLSHLSFDRKLGPLFQRPGVRSLPVAVYGLLVFLGMYAVSGFLPFSNWINSLILGLGALVVWFSLDRTWQGLVLAAGTAIVGTAMEIALVKAGAFFYLPKAADFFGVPSWLPWLYVSASVAVGNFARYLSRNSVSLL